MRNSVMTTKRKVVQVVVTFADGTTDTFKIDGIMSESINARKKGGFANLQEWVEYHITWVTYVRELDSLHSTGAAIDVAKEIKKADRESLRGIAWCAQHGCEPSDCFTRHVAPTAFSGREQQWNDVEAVAKKELPDIFKLGKAGIMRAYGITEEGLKEWIEKEEVVWPEFDLTDLKEGYGNGHVRPE